MSKNLYITASEPVSGKSVITLGVMEFLIRNLEKVAFFRPIISGDREKDSVINLISSYYHLDIPYRNMYAYTLDEAKSLIAEGSHDDLLNGILDSYKKLENEHDFVLCLGTDNVGESSVLGYDVNTEIANNIGCPQLLVINAHRKKATDIIKSCQVAVDHLEEQKCDLLSIIINQTPTDVHKTIVKRVTSKLKSNLELIYSIPQEKTLDYSTMAEVAGFLGAEVLFGVRQLNRLVSKVMVTAMHLRNFLPRLTEGSLIITPVDRLDAILGVLAALRSQTMPSISGIVLTGNMKPDHVLFDLLEGIPDIVPVLKLNDDTFTTATKISHLRSKILPDDPRKIAMALGIFESNVDSTELRQKIIGHSVSVITPKMFEFSLIKRARSHKQHIVLPEGDDERVLAAAEILLHREIASVTLLGDVERIRKKISDLGLDLGETAIINPRQSSLFEEYANTYFDLRRHKGITHDNALDVMSSVNYFGTMMVHKGDADGMVSGAVHSTRTTVIPAFEIIKTKPGCPIMSSVFLMCLKDRVLVYGDCAVNPNPTATQLAEIAIRSAETAIVFGVKPLVAMLSYSSGTSGIGTDVDKVREATEIVRRLEPDLPIEGPIQYDAAVDLTVGKAKMPDSEVAGRATIFIFPDLNTGNNTYKAVQRSANAVAVGPVMQGLNKPVNDLSRGCTVNDIVNTIAITAIQAQAKKGLL